MVLCVEAGELQANCSKRIEGEKQGEENGSRLHKMVNSFWGVGGVGGGGDGRANVR